jgi:hypothetical protein
LITGDRKRAERSARGAEPKRAGAAGRSSCNRKNAAPLAALRTTRRLPPDGINTWYEGDEEAKRDGAVDPAPAIIRRCARRRGSVLFHSRRFCWSSCLSRTPAHLRRGWHSADASRTASAWQIRFSLQNCLPLPAKAVAAFGMHRTIGAAWQRVARQLPRNGRGRPAGRPSGRRPGLFSRS